MGALFGARRGLYLARKTNIRAYVICIFGTHYDLELHPILEELGGRTE